MVSIVVQICLHYSLVTSFHRLVLFFQFLHADEWSFLTNRLVTTFLTGTYPK